MPTVAELRLAAEIAACEAGCMPPRYRRNGRMTTPAQQAALLRARVLLVGLGGLGGHVLDALLRMGVGHITGVDGDSFEESNLNRQLLCTQENMGQSKAQAAVAHAQRVNSAVDVVPVPTVVHGAAWAELIRGGHRALGFDVVVDALGGLEDRQALHTAAQRANIPVVTAGIAGLTGWVQLLRAGDKGPMDYFSQHQRQAWELGGSESAEEMLGNLVPTVMLAAGVQCAHVYTLLTGGVCRSEMLIFDAQDLCFMPIRP
ncbi:MAG: ThiF family adenylyltransferase [Desulfovibrionaceae bacterium]